MMRHITMKRKGGKLVRKNSVAALHRTCNKPSAEATTSATKGLACRLRSLSVPLTDIIKNNSVKYQLGFEEEEHGVWKFKASAKQNTTRYHKQKSNVTFKEYQTRFANNHNAKAEPVIDNSLSGVKSQDKSKFINKPSVQSRSGRAKSSDSTVSLNSDVVLISGSQVHTQSETPRLSLRSSKNKVKEIEKVKSRPNNNCVQNNRSQEANVKISRGHGSGSISLKTDVEPKFNSKASLNTDNVRKSPRRRTASNPPEAKNEKTQRVGRLGTRESDNKVVKNVQEVVRTINTPKKSKSHVQLNTVKDKISTRSLSLRNKRKRAGSLSVDKAEVKKLKFENLNSKKKLPKRKQSDISNKSQVEVEDVLDSDTKLNRLGKPYSRTPRKRLNKVKMGWCSICGIELHSVENKLQHEFSHQESRLLFVSLHRCNLRGSSVKLPVYVDCKEVDALKSPPEDLCTSTDDSCDHLILEVENVLNEDECDAYEDYSDSEEENENFSKEVFLEEATPEVSQCNINEVSILGDTSSENVTKVDQSLSLKSPKKSKKKGHIKMRLWENTQPQTTRCGRVVKLTQKYEENKLVFKKSTNGIEDEKIDESVTDKVIDSVNSSQEEVLNDYVEVVVAKENLKKSEESSGTELNPQESVISCENQEQSSDLLKDTNEQTTLSEEVPSEKTDVNVESNEDRDQGVTHEGKISDECNCTEPSAAGNDDDGCEINGCEESANEENVGKTVTNITRPSIDLEDAETEDAPSLVLAKTCEIKDKDQCAGLKKKVGIMKNDSGKVANDSDYVPKNSDLNVNLEDSSIQSDNQDEYDTEKADRKETSEKSDLKEVEIPETIKSIQEYLTKTENISVNATDDVENKIVNKSNVNINLEDENDEDSNAFRTEDCSLKASNLSETKNITENENSNTSDADALENNCIADTSEKSNSGSDDHFRTNHDGLEDISDEEFDFNDEEKLDKNGTNSLECLDEGKERKAEDIESIVEGAGEDGSEEQNDNLAEEDNLKMDEVGNDGRIAFQMALESVEAVLEEDGSGDKSECLGNDSEEFFQEKVKVGISEDVETEFENVSVEEDEEEEDEEEGVEDIEKAEIAEEGGGEEDFDEGDKVDSEMCDYLGEKTMDEAEKEYANIGDGGMDPSTENVVGETKEGMEGCNKVPVEMADVDDSSDPDHCISSDKLDSVILGRKYDETECSTSEKQKERFVKANDVSNDNIVCVDNEDIGDDGCDIEGYDACAINGITDIVNAPLPFEDVNVVTSVDRYTEGKDKTATECEG